MNAQIGSISHGTMRPEDIIPIFADELARLDKAKVYSELIKEAMNIDWDYIDWNNYNDNIPFIVDSLSEALNSFTPPYCYFGAHPGDGSDYGFWPLEDIQEDFDGLKVSDISEVPKKYNGEVLHINDHSNVTLYSCKKGKLKEIWSFV